MITVARELFALSALGATSGVPGSLREWLALLGRMHVIVIHFPIALLLMAALGEVWGRVRRHPAGWTTACVLFGAIGAAISMSLGWMLVWFSGYENSSTLTLHQYLGTATALVAIGTAAAHWKLGRGRTRWWITALIVATAAMGGITGHLGGTLVHGSLFAP